VIAAQLLWGCAHGRNPRLVQAEQEFRAAETDPVVAEHAPLLLEDARDALSRGQKAWRRGADEDEVDHLAYLAARRVEIARLSAQREADLERAEDLSRQRGSPPVVVVTPGAGTPPAVAVPHAASVIEDIHFDPARVTLPSGARRDLARAVDLINAHPGVAVRVEGHADSSERNALALSAERAEQVAQELVALGVDPDRLVVRGLGIESDRRSSRRVDIVLGPVLGAR
jgi:outer membrane protein OmpA-like peptidoglycan-associated protein